MPLAVSGFTESPCWDFPQRLRESDRKNRFNTCRRRLLLAWLLFPLSRDYRYFHLLATKEQN
jgi:hypothetical protein